MKNYTDEQFTSLITAGCAPSLVIQAAGADVDADTLLLWVKDRKDVPTAIAAYAAQAARIAELEKNAPIRIRSGRDEGTILKAGKNRGQAGEATGALLEVTPAPRTFQPCTPAQVAQILSNPTMAIDLACQVDAGLHDGTGYDRDPQYSVPSLLQTLKDVYSSLGVENRIETLAPSADLVA